MHYIYKITNLINSKIYIGQTKNLYFRWASHKTAAKTPQKYKTIISKAMYKHNVDNFIFEAICCCKNQDDANYIEDIIINQENSRDENIGYNIKPGGNTSSGWHHKEETKKKISDAHKLLDRDVSGIKNPFYGKQHSEETKEKNRSAHLGKITSEETKRKISEKSSSRTYSEETKQKHRDYQTGRKYSKEDKNKMSEAKKGRTWKLVNEKRVWSEKIS